MEVVDAQILPGYRFGEIYERLKDQPRLTEVRRLPTPASRHDFELLAREGYPIVFRVGPDAPEGQQVLSRLKERYGDLALSVRVGDYHQPGAYAAPREYRTVPLAGYLDSLSQPHEVSMPPYAGNQKLSLAMCEQLGVLPPAFYDAQDYEEPSLWLGPPGCVTPLHKDGTDNFAWHLLGSKRWLLYPVRDAPWLYLRRILPDPLSDFAASEVDLLAPDLQRFPLLAQAVPVEVIVQEGEMLYLPAGWAHFVQNETLSLMINYWGTRTARRAPAVLTTP